MVLKVLLIGSPTSVFLLRFPRGCSDTYDLKAWMWCIYSCQWPVIAPCLKEDELPISEELHWRTEERCNYCRGWLMVPHRCVAADKSVICFNNIPILGGWGLLTLLPTLARKVRPLHIPVSVQTPKMLRHFCQSNDVTFIVINWRQKQQNQSI